MNKEIQVFSLFKMHKELFQEILTLNLYFFLEWLDPSYYDTGCSCW